MLLTGGECVMRAKRLVYAFFRRKLWRPILDPVTRTIGNNLKGDWEKGQIQDMLSQLSG